MLIEKCGDGSNNNSMDSPQQIVLLGLDACFEDLDKRRSRILALLIFTLGHKNVAHDFERSHFGVVN